MRLDSFRLSSRTWLVQACRTGFVSALWLLPASAFAQDEPEGDEAASDGQAAEENAEDPFADLGGESEQEADEPTEGASPDATASAEDLGAEEASVDASLGLSGETESSGSEVSTGGGLFESAGSSTDEMSAEGLSLTWGGYVRGDVFIGLDGPTGDPGINAAYGELSFQPKVKAGDKGSAVADLRLRYGQQLAENELFVDLREAYTSAYLGPIELRVGKQVVVWGRADAFNPTSNIAPVDFRIRSPEEDDRRIGTVGARGYLNFRPFKLEAVWMPLFEPTMYPDFDLDDPLVRFVDPRYPTLSVRDSLTAARLHVETSAIEASVSYLYGNAPLPGLDVEGFDLGANVDVRVRRRSYRHHVLGLDFAAIPAGLFGVRGEAAFRSPVQYETRYWAARPDVQWVLGVDKELGPVMVIAQYLGRYTLDFEGDRPVESGGTAALGQLNPNAPDSFDRATTGTQNTVFNVNRMLFSQLYEMQSLASLRAEWKTLHETLSISALGLVNFNTQEWLLMPKVGYQIAGGMNAYLGAEIYSGPEGTLFDQIDEKLTSVYSELRVSF